jgi:hypothetical protein
VPPLEENEELIIVLWPATAPTIQENKINNNFFFSGPTGAPHT